MKKVFSSLLLLCMFGLKATGKLEDGSKIQSLASSTSQEQIKKGKEDPLKLILNKDGSLNKDHKDEYCRNLATKLSTIVWEKGSKIGIKNEKCNGFLNYIEKKNPDDKNYKFSYTEFPEGEILFPSEADEIKFEGVNNKRLFCLTFNNETKNKEINIERYGYFVPNIRDLIIQALAESGSQIHIELPALNGYFAFKSLEKGKAPNGSESVNLTFRATREQVLIFAPNQISETLHPAEMLLQANRVSLSSILGDFTVDDALLEAEFEKRLCLITEESFLPLNHSFEMALISEKSQLEQDIFNKKMRCVDFAKELHVVIERGEKGIIEAYEQIEKIIQLMVSSKITKKDLIVFTREVTEYNSQLRREVEKHRFQQLGHSDSQQRDILFIRDLLLTLKTENFINKKRFVQNSNASFGAKDKLEKERLIKVVDQTYELIDDVCKQDEIMFNISGRNAEIDENSVFSLINESLTKLLIENNLTQDQVKGFIKEINSVSLEQTQVQVQNLFCYDRKQYTVYRMNNLGLNDKGVVVNLMGNEFVITYDTLRKIHTKRNSVHFGINPKDTFTCFKFKAEIQDDSTTLRAISLHFKDDLSKEEQEQVDEVWKSYISSRVTTEEIKQKDTEAKVLIKIQNGEIYVLAYKLEIEESNKLFRDISIIHNLFKKNALDSVISFIRNSFGCESEVIYAPEEEPNYQRSVVLFIKDQAKFVDFIGFKSEEIESHRLKINFYFEKHGIQGTIGLIKFLFGVNTKVVYSFEEDPEVAEAMRRSKLDYEKQQSDPTAASSSNAKIVQVDAQVDDPELAKAIELSLALEKQNAGTQNPIDIDNEVNDPELAEALLRSKLDYEKQQSDPTAASSSSSGSSSHAKTFIVETKQTKEDTADNLEKQKLNQSKATARKVVKSVLKRISDNIIKEQEQEEIKRQTSELERIKEKRALEYRKKQLEEGKAQKESRNIKVVEEEPVQHKTILELTSEPIQLRNNTQLVEIPVTAKLSINEGIDISDKKPYLFVPEEDDEEYFILLISDEEKEQMLNSGDNMKPVKVGIMLTTLVFQEDNIQTGNCCILQPIQN